MFPDSVEEEQDKALLRLGITYGVLMRVGLPQDVVEECIQGMSGVDLEDATTWFTLNRPDVNLGEIIRIQLHRIGRRSLSLSLAGVQTLESFVCGRALRLILSLELLGKTTGAVFASPTAFACFGLAFGCYWPLAEAHHAANCETYGA